VQGTTAQEHDKYGHRLLADRIVRAQELGNRSEKVRKVEATKTDNLELPEGSSLQGILQVVHPIHK
jgi:hypothetical protein